MKSFLKYPADSYKNDFQHMTDQTYLSAVISVVVVNKVIYCKLHVYTVYFLLSYTAMILGSRWLIDWLIDCRVLCFLHLNKVEWLKIGGTGKYKFVKKKIQDVLSV
jgi:hypothetical protein